MSTRLFRWQDYHVAVDPRPQVLHLEMEPSASLDQMLRQAARRRTSDGIERLDPDLQAPFQGPLYPSLSALPENRRFERSLISAATLAQKARAVDDGVVAALELLFDEGAVSFPGRTALLCDWQGILRQEWDRSPENTDRAEAIGLLAAARSLAGDDDPDVASWPAALRLRRSRRLKEAREDPGSSIPLGVYSWSPRLAGLYRQGKTLQQPLETGIAPAFAGALHSDRRLRDAYERHLAIASLTNPLAGPDLLSAPTTLIGEERRPAVFPPSESPEGRLVKCLVGSNPVPPGFDLIRELMARIIDGRLTLAPTPESGWYDHVLHALEPLLTPDRTPEAAKLRFGRDYREDLKDLFRSLLASTRESHVKQMEMPMVGAGLPPLVISPQLTFEPLAEHYRRRAASYRFVRERLTSLLGEDVLLSRSRMTPRGETGVSVLDELILMEQLYTGAWAVVLDELGIGIEAGSTEGHGIRDARAAARVWAASHRDDPDLREDIRMMVPLFWDIERKEFHILAVVGIEERNLNVRFAERPEVTVLDDRGRAADPRIVWDDATYPLARPVTIACRTKRLLDRDTFRALCDRAGSVSGIRSAVEG